MGRAFRTTAWLAVVGCLAFAGWWSVVERRPVGDWRYPDRWNPFAPLDVADAPNALTRLKLARASADAGRCHAALATADWRFEPLPDTDPAPGCGLRDAVRLTPLASGRSRAPLVSVPLVLSCPAAVSLALWERHVVQPAAATHLRGTVARIEHYGTYACRDIEGREGRKSEHATADAIDVAAFVLGDRRRIVVAAEPRGDGAEAFLDEVHAGACRFWNGVLGPRYNRAHADHFHLDRGPFRICR